MLPNIMMNAMPMSPSMPVGTFPTPIAPQSGTAGFDFNTYLLGLQTNATDGKVDIAQLLQANPTAELLKDANGTDANTANGMGALAALFNMPTTIGKAEPTLPAIEGQPLPIASGTVALATPAKIDWSAMGMTEVTPAEIQEQGWDMKKVEQLFANRVSDLKPEADLTVEAHQAPIKMTAQLPTEKAHAFQSEPLTQNQPVMQMAERSQTVASQNNRPKEAAAAGVQTSPVAREAVVAEKRARNESKVDTSPENSLFSALMSQPSTSTTKTDAFTAVAAPMTTSASHVQSAQPQEWVTRTETMAQNGGGKMTIALTPPELGKVEIEVTTRGKNVEVEIRSETDGARKALESGMSDLKSALLGQDLVLSKSEVKVGAMERFQMDGFNNQNPSQTFHNPYTSQDRQDSSNQSQNGFERSNRWEVAQGKTIESNRSLASRFTPSNDGRLDVRI